MSRGTRKPSDRKPRDYRFCRRVALTEAEFRLLAIAAQAMGSTRSGVMHAAVRLWLTYFARDLERERAGRAASSYIERHLGAAGKSSQRMCQADCLGSREFFWNKLKFGRGE